MGRVGIEREERTTLVDMLHICGNLSLTILAKKLGTQFRDDRLVRGVMDQMGQEWVIIGRIVEEKRVRRAQGSLISVKQ
jgi:hypothetical protein